ncbi:hypothetical protein BZA77DRAFT_301799 [Pyronema omphalodes]|nr:hypothetical protein BZA77DRAFT_301799 [Pyronema omphalodes]
MASQAGRSDRIFQWATGANSTQAIINFQKCVADRNQTDFGGSNADLGGIGVITSLTFLCAGCTIGSIFVIALGYTFAHPKYKSRPPGSLLNRFLTRIYDAAASPLVTFLDAALFLALTMQIAAIIWSAKIDRAGYISDEAGRQAAIDGFGKGSGGRVYSIYILLYTSVITTCPALTLISTPYLWDGLKRRGYRLFVMTVLMLIGGIVNLLWTEIAGQLSAYDLPHAGCVSIFLFEVIPGQTEKNVLRSAWVLCFTALILIIIIQAKKNCPRPILRWYRAMRGFLRKRVWPSFGHFFKAIGRFFVHQFRKLFKRPALDEQPIDATVSGNHDDVEVEGPRSQNYHRKRRIARKLIIVLYALIYVAMQALPLYLLWRIYWLREHVRNILQPPPPSGIIYPAFANATKLLEEEKANWDLDNWTFGQILAMSLWFPALLEAAYILIAGEEPLTGAKVWDGTKEGAERSEPCTSCNAHDDSLAKEDDVQISEIKAV